MAKEWSKQVFSTNLQRYVAQSGKTQREIAEAIGVTAPTFNEWMNGKKFARIDKIQRLADYFGILKSDLIEDKATQEKKAKTDVAVDIMFRLGEDAVFCEAVKLLYQLEKEQIEAVTPVLRSLLK